MCHDNVSTFLVACSLIFQWCAIQAAIFGDGRDNLNPTVTLLLEFDTKFLPWSRRRHFVAQFGSRKRKKNLFDQGTKFLQICWNTFIKKRYLKSSVRIKRNGLNYCRAQVYRGGGHRG